MRINVYLKSECDISKHGLIIYYRILEWSMCYKQHDTED